MNLPELKKVDNADSRINKFQGYVKDQFSLINFPGIRGRFLEENGSNLISLTTTSREIEHKLGIEPEGFIVLFLDTNAVIWWDRTGSEDRSKFIRLDASAICQAKVWVF